MGSKPVTFSGNVGNIWDYAFWDCDVLTTIYVPASTTEDTIDMIREGPRDQRTAQCED